MSRAAVVLLLALSACGGASVDNAVEGAGPCCASADGAALCNGPAAVVESASLECYPGEICEVYAPNPTGGAPREHLLEGTCAAEPK